MECSLDANAPLDYAIIHIFPTQNRYEVSICGDGEVEKLSGGLLEQLSPHLPEVHNLQNKGSNAKFKLQVVALDEKAWFTKSTLNRFLQLVASPDLLISCKHIQGEMSQLEEARKFHLSLNAQGNKDHLKSDKTDGCNSIETEPTPEEKMESSDTSKDALLRAMDLRLTALRKELAATLNQAASFTNNDVINLRKFCDHFGATDLKNYLCNFFELMCESDASVIKNDDKNSSLDMSSRGDADKTNVEIQIPRSIYAQTPVKYGVSPAKVAQIERQSSSESEESSNAGDENQASPDRGRILSRAAQPRRSASPMRRVQIGRTGSRRAPALAIKSLGYYPARDRNPCYRDAAGNSSEDEGSEQLSKKPESNVVRMTVQDAIHLFESKQKDQHNDTQKRSSLSNHSLSTNKSVLRRWSAGRVEGSVPCQPELVSEDSILLSHDDNVVVDGEDSKLTEVENSMSDFISGQSPSVSANIYSESGKLEKEAHDSVDMQMDDNGAQGQESNGMPTPSADWSQQKEVELNQMLKRMMEKQPAKTRKPQTSRKQNIPSEHRGGFYDHYKEKRDEKLRGENARRKAEKEAQFRAMQKILDDRKAEMASKSVKDVGKKHPTPKPQKSLRNPSQAANLRSESPKASVTRKISSKASNLPATRKSWPLAPSATVAGSSPSKTPGIANAGTTPTRRKPQSTAPNRLSTKVERSQPRHGNVKENQNDGNRSLKGATERVQTVKKFGKTTKTKVASAAEDSPVPSKPSLYNKMTKKSSIVPLESKPFLRKGSRVVPGVGPIATKTKSSSHLEASSMNCGSITKNQSVDMAVDATILASEHQSQVIVPVDHGNTAIDSETVSISHQNCDESGNTNELTTDADDSYKESVESAMKIQFQEQSDISPMAWEEIEEEKNVHNSHGDGTSQIASPAHVAPLGLSSQRVRHSLSQMLQEDNNSETDTVEWGNAEHPPAIVYQKDAPKGLKRLLKFARKSKGEGHVTGCSSPSVFSEGEDDGEESAVSKRSTDNLLRKAALRSKNYGQKDASLFGTNEKNADAHEPPAQISKIKFDSQSSNKLHKGPVSASASASTTKATRSFFSLSAFRGSKPNDAKFN